jgi:hypothetical protein
MVLNPKPVPRILVPTTRRRIFKTKYVIEIFIPKAYSMIDAKPVTPPPII